MHISVFLFGFTAILGRLISLSALSLVWWRLILTCAVILFIPKVLNTVRTTPRKKVLEYCGIGIVVALHWLCFYGSVKYANASIALTTFATTALFTSILEPLYFKKSFNSKDILLGIIVIPAMWLIVNSSDPDMYLGIILGIAGAALASTFAVLNKKVAGEIGAFALTFIELGAGLLFLTLLLPIYLAFDENATFIPNNLDWIYLLILSIVCTVLAFNLSLRALRHISAFASSLALNLEPIYGIILAVFLLKEHQELNTQFYIGSALIVSAVFFHAFSSSSKKKLNDQA